MTKAAVPLVFDLSCHSSFRGRTLLSEIDETHLHKPASQIIATPGRLTVSHCPEPTQIMRTGSGCLK